MKRRIPGLFLALLVVAALTAALAVGAVAGGGKGNKKDFEYAIGLWGDMPYSDTQARTGVPNLIADLNDQDLEFTVHNGDLKAGGGTPGSLTVTTCADGLYTQALSYFNALKQPAIFTPGDNDWADCDRASNGSFDSGERLDKERAVFFSTNRSLGQKTLKQDVQDATVPCLNALDARVACVENRRWTVKKVTYVTVNLPGSCNNLCDTLPDPAESAARDAANIAWLEQSFAAATEKDSAGLMIIGQANPGFDLSDPTRAPTRNPASLVQTSSGADGYQAFLLKLRELTADFKKPVVYVHGDSHYFRVDRPLLDATGKRLENFTRVETFGNSAVNGNNDVHWVKALVDPKSRDVFAFQAQIVPANRVAVPAP